MKWILEFVVAPRPGRFGPDWDDKPWLSPRLARGLAHLFLFWFLCPVVAFAVANGYALCQAATVAALARLPALTAAKMLGPVFAGCSIACFFTGYADWFVGWRADRSPQSDRLRVVWYCLVAEVATIQALILLGLFRQ
ncbi:MAG: hypothetical protein U0746_03035 [Gemmataceae bacterium]